MPIDSIPIRAHEWIGLRVNVVSATDPTHKGVTGIVEDETRNMFTIRTNDRTIRIPKEKTCFLVEHPSQAFNVEGNTIKHRPEDRIKKAVEKW